MLSKLVKLITLLLALFTVVIFLNLLNDRLSLPNVSVVWKYHNPRMLGEAQFVKDDLIYIKTLDDKYLGIDRVTGKQITQVGIEEGLKLTSQSSKIGYKRELSTSRAKFKLHVLCIDSCTDFKLSASDLKTNKEVWREWGNVPSKMFMLGDIVYYSSGEYLFAVK